MAPIFAVFARGSHRGRTVRVLSAILVTIGLLAGLTHVSAAQEVPEDTTPTTSTEESTTSTEESTTTTSTEESTTTTSTEGSTTTTSTTAPPEVDEDEDGPIVLAVPNPGADQSVITVKVGGERSGLASVLPRAGVTLQLFDNATTTTPTTFVTPNTCVSDAAGDCSWLVRNTGGSIFFPQVNNDRRFFVRQTGTPAGTFANPELNVGLNSWPATDYQFQTCPNLESGSICRSTATGENGFMQSTGGEVTASGGIWQTSRANPALPARCGLRVALVLDLSGSVGAQLPALQTAATTFVNSLVGTPSSVGLFTFASNGPANTTNNANRPITSVSTTAGATTVNGWINGTTVQTTEQYTNWDRALNQVTESAQAYDIALVVTDGNPTAYGLPPTTQTNGTTRFREVENGIFSANGLKAENTRVIAFGVGAGVNQSGENLRSISGPTLNSDYFQTTDYSAAAGVLRALALGSCNGSVSVIKQVIPPGGTTANAAPAPGWTFGATTTASGVTISPASKATDATGGVSFGLTFPGGVGTAPVTVTETQKPGYTLVRQQGSIATCTNLNTGAVVATSNVGQLGFRVDAPSTSAISCVVYNRAPDPPATVRVDKQWIVNGTTYANGAQPPGLSAQLTLNGAAAGFGSVSSGFIQGQTVQINETVTNQLPLCTVDSQRVTLANGATVNVAVPPAYNATLLAGANTYRITNVVTCTSSLQLTKSVVGGSAPATSWTLSAVPPSGALPGPSGTTGVTANVTPGRTYPLAESGGNPNYVQDIAPGAVLIPGSTGSWVCIQVDAAGNQIPGFGDGVNGGVTVPLGQRVRCTATNRTVELVLRKVVVNTFGGTATPDDWELTLTPTGTPRPGVVAQTVTGSNVGAALQVRPGQTYSLSESGGPPGYALDPIECNQIPVTSITPQIGQNVVCTFTNRDVRPTLRLVKTVDNNSGAGTAVPADWTLTADGPTPISGATPVVGPVDAGTYTLSETGPDGYASSGWSCTGATGFTSTSVTLGPGENATCTINNTAIQPTLTLVKEVQNLSGGAAVPTDWTLSAAGPTPISGETGEDAITTAPVDAGTYTLSESAGPAGYTAGAWSCTAGTLTGNSLVLAAGVSATCTIVNTDAPAALTLVKTVTNDDGGTALPTAWTLTADGPTDISGPTGSEAVTAAIVDAGTYTLSESGGPDGYTTGAWSCTAGTLTGASLVLTPGVSATCTITNDDQPAFLTLRKLVTNDNGGDAVPEDWVLTATGPTTGVSGIGGTAAVTVREVDAGTYVLSEAGPPGYADSPWVCDAGTLTGDVLVLTPGVSATCEIVNNDVGPGLTLVKTVTNDNGGTALPTAWTLSAVGPQDTITGTTPVSGAIDAGVYTLSESGGPEGYTTGTWSCDAGILSGTTFVLPPGVNATCTINNDDQPAELTLRKTVDNGPTGAANGPTDWTLTATPVSGPGQPPVSGNGDPASPGGVSEVPVFAGAYDLTELGPDGYTASAWTCTGGTLTGSRLTVPSGGSADCSITNTAVQPTLTLVKEVDNSNGSGTAVATEWTLRAAAGPTEILGTTGSDEVTEAAVPIGTYALSETGGPDGYTPSAWSCVGGTFTTSSVTLALGEDATCTITNTAVAPTLTLVKEVVNDDGGTQPATAWTLTGTGPTTISGPTGDPLVSDAVVEVGTYALTESTISGYTASDWDCVGATSVTGTSVTLDSGDAATCTITNDDQPASLALSKLVDNGDGAGDAVAADFPLTATPQGITGQEPVSGDGGVPATGVLAGSYVLSETTVPGYTPGTWSCTGGVLTGNTVVVLNGGVVACEITNTAVAPALTLVKVVVNDDGGTEPATAWTLTATGPTTISGATGDLSLTNAVVEVGTYTLTESTIAGYEASNWVCEGSATSSSPATVTLDSGQSATCTITNDDVAPSLTLDKVVTNDDGGTAVETDWTLTATPDAAIVGQNPVTGAGGVAATDVLPGTYTLSETEDVPGYEASGWSCVGASEFTGTTVTVALGQTVTCTIDNDDIPASLSLDKVVTNNNGGTAVEADWTLTASPSDIVDQGPVDGVGGVPPTEVLPGTYTLSESDGPDGYSASDWVCTGASVSTATTVTVALGETVVCTITNDDVAPSLSLDKVVTNNNGGTAVETDWTLTATPDAIDGQDPVTGVGGVAPSDVLPGTYTLSESVGPDGYEASVWSCVGATSSTASTVTVALGQTVVCTINNDDIPASLSLDKVVTNNNGGTAVETDWTLTATPDSIVGQGPLTGAGGVAPTDVLPGTYTLSETGDVPGYEASGWSCVGATSSTATTVTVALGETVTCTIDNDDIAPSLSLDKVVTNNNGGTAVETDWTLTATPDGIDGQDPVSGEGGVAPTDVLPGTYTLSESEGPEGYEASGWTCVGATSSTATTVTIALGQTVTCTINNDDQPATLTLVKSVINDNGGEEDESAWELTATGPTAGVSGITGSGEVTNRVVDAGSYVLSEDGPAGYFAAPWECEGGTFTGDRVVLPPGASAVCTIVNDDIGPGLTLIKTVTNDNGGTASATDWTLSAIGPDTITGTTPVSEAVDAGIYTLSEDGGPAGYTAGPWSCDGGILVGATLILPPGVGVVCTINNDDQPAELTLRKVVDNGTTGAINGPTDWTVTATPVSISGQVPVSGNGDPTSPAGVNDVSVFAGAYDLTELGPAGYTASDWTCTGGTLSGSRVTVPGGGSVDCSITNTAIEPTLTLVKEVDNGAGAGTAEATEWTLRAEGETEEIVGATGSDEVTDALVPIGTYALSEAGPAGYTPSAWSCVGGTSTTSSVALALGESATCTITNTAVAPTLTLVKDVVNDDGGTVPATAWTLTATGPTTISGPTDDPLVTDAVVEVGTYALTESTIPGYEASDWVCEGTATSTTATTVTLDSGQSATCTITNDDIAPSLALDKVVVNNNGGTAVEADWTLTATPDASIGGQVPVTGAGGVDATDVLPGTYTLSESAGPDGYDASEWSCVGATSSTATTVTIALDQTVTCTITNDDVAPSLSLDKVVTNNNGGTAVEADWTLTATPDGIDDQDPVDGVGGVAPTDVLPGTYTLSESDGPDGYEASEWSCVGATSFTDTTVTVALGETVVCTITNDDIPASLSLDKVVTNNNGGTAVEADWTLTATPDAIDGQDPVTGVGGVAPTDVLPGTYTLTETGDVPGYAASGWSCVGATSSTASTVTVALGETVVCTINNDDVAPSLSLDKVVTNNNGGTTVESDWTLTATPDSIVGQDPLTGAGGVVPTDVLPGTYTLSETGDVPGYEASGWSCVGATSSTDTTVTVALGETVTCTIDNDDIPASLSLDKVVTNNNGGTAVETDWTLTATPDAVEGQDPVSGEGGVPPTDVLPGTYTLSESEGPEGYQASGWTCVGATSSTATTVTVALGQTVTCTINNDDQQATLALDKVVINDNGGTAVDTDWTLTADLDGQEVLSGAGGVAATDVVPGTYVLSETDDVPDYRPRAWSCDGASSSTDDTVTVGLGQTVTCRIVNDDGEARLTLVKDVVNDSGGTATADEWTLSAAGRTPITGVTGSPAVTDALVSPGRYVLSEAGGPAGYSPSAWACTDVDGEPVDAEPLVLGDEADVTCTIVNDDQTAWTMTKTAVPPTDSVVDPGTTVTYTIAATKTDGVDPTNITITDDLSDVLDDAALVTGSMKATTGEATLTDDILTWAIPTLAGRETVSYQVTVDDGAVSVTLVNVATGAGVTPPTDCATATPATSTTTSTTLVTTTPTSDPTGEAVALAADVSASCVTTHTTKVTGTGIGTGPRPPVRTVSTTARVLAFTGNDPVVLVRFALLLLALGAGIVIWQHRRSRA